MVQTIIIATLLLFIAYLIYKLYESKNVSNALLQNANQKILKMEDIKRIILHYDSMSTDIIEWMKDNAFFEDADSAKERYETWKGAVIRLGEEYKELL